MPKVSVIIPVYNCDQYLNEAIDSILNQTYRDFEVIVVDDASTDKSREIIAQYEAQNHPFFRAIYHERNKGVSAARNNAISVSLGEFLLFADSDDIHEKDRLAASIRAFEENSDLDVVFVDCQMMDGEGRLLHRQKGYPIGMTSENAVLYQLKRNHLWIGLAMLRKTPDIWFDETIPNAVDYELFLRLLLKGIKINIINKLLVRYRVHQNNISGNRKVSGNSVEKILQRLNFDEMFNSFCNKYDEEAVRIAIASALLTAGQFEKALTLVCDIDWSSNLVIEGLFVQGISYYKLGRLQESMDVFKRAKILSPEDAAILNNLGVLIIMLGEEIDVACQFFETALVLRPGYLDAKHNITQLTENAYHSLCITERPLREKFIHIENYKL